MRIKTLIESDFMQMEIVEIIKLFNKYGYIIYLFLNW